MLCQEKWERSLVLSDPSTKSSPTKGTPPQAPLEVPPPSALTSQEGGVILLPALISLAITPSKSSSEALSAVVPSSSSKKKAPVKETSISPGAASFNTPYWPKWSITNSTLKIESSEVAYQLLRGIFLSKDIEFFESQPRKELMKMNEMSTIGISVVLVHLLYSSLSVVFFSNTVLPCSL
ncbi:hypothetical protein NE237_013376 [Protea cynaroides]|uniref:Uncharacterized protein n=1 Tax=Protea cynaroides TaxID=273540 RepID=A0A9Q0GZ80_9MAGN|nr:hypothetical protein NE237_013376 [Protea cynaroides]